MNDKENILFDPKSGEVAFMKAISILILAMCSSVSLHAQASKMDKELTALVDAVRILRNPSESSFNQTTKLLKADERWTPMRETGELKDTECKPSDKVPSFKLNRILNSVEKERKHVSTTGTMLNGEDSRYSYSLYERSLKKGKSATYSLRKRSGRQTFVVVPYVKKKGSLSVLVNGRKVKTLEQEDGTIVWGRMAVYLQGKKRIFFSADGVLNNIGIEYLPLNRKPLSEQYEVYRLSSTKELCYKHESRIPTKAALFGDINYNE